MLASAGSWFVVVVVGWIFAWTVSLMAAVAHVQTFQGSSGSFDTTATTSSATLTGGNLLLCAAMGTTGGTPPAVTSVATSGAENLTLAKSCAANTSGNEIWYRANVTGGSQTVTSTWASNWTFKRLTCTEVSGAATSSPVDGSGASAGGNGTSASTGAYSANGSSFWFASVSAGGSSSFSVGGSWTIPTNGSGTSDGPGAVAYLANPGSGSQTATFTITNSDYAVCGTAFLVASAGGLPPGSFGLMEVGR